MHVLGEQVVLDEPAILRTVLRDDGVVLVVDEQAAHRWLSPLRVAGASLPDHVPGYEQADLAVDHPAPPGDLRVGALGSDLVAEEPRGLAGRVRDQGFG